MKLNTFRPGKYWYDNNGNKIQAHGGSIIKVEDTFYWYGENKEGVYGFARGEKCPIWHNGVNMYSSKDLYNWEFCSTVIVSDDENNPFHPANVMDRPHIIYNEKTKKFVMWAKTYNKEQGGFENSVFSIAISDKIDGQYTFLHSLNTGISAGDFDLVIDDNKAYCIYEKPHTEMICHELDDTFTTLTDKYSSHIIKVGPPYTREAPCFFKRGDRKFILTSGTSGYFPNKTILYEIPSFHGEWIDLGDPCVDDKYANSFHSQFSSVYNIPNTDTYIALGDRWLTDLPVNLHSSVTEEAFEILCGVKKSNRDIIKELREYSDEATENATYVWLKISFKKDGSPYIEWENSWKY